MDFCPFCARFRPIRGPSLSRFWGETDTTQTHRPSARVLPWPARQWHRTSLFLSAPHSTLLHSSPLFPTLPLAAAAAVVAVQLGRVLAQPLPLVAAELPKHGHLVCAPAGQIWGGSGRS